MKIELGAGWSNGLVFGVRHFQPEEYAPYFEIQFFLVLIQIYIIIDNGNTDSNSN